MTLEFYSSSRTQSFGNVHDDSRKESDNGEDLDLKQVMTFSHFDLLVFLLKFFTSKRSPQKPVTTFLNISFKASLTRSLRKA